MDLSAKLGSIPVVSGSNGGMTFIPRESRSPGSSATTQDAGTFVSPSATTKSLSADLPSPVSASVVVMEKFATRLQDFLAASDMDFQVRVSDVANRIVVQVLSASTGEVVREIPPDEILRVLNNLSTQIRPVLVSLEA